LRTPVTAIVAAAALVFAGTGAVVATAAHEPSSTSGAQAPQTGGSHGDKVSRSPSPHSETDIDEDEGADEQQEGADEDGPNRQSVAHEHQHGDDHPGGATGSGDSGQKG
jgi:hypothetical protein